MGALLVLPGDTPVAASEISVQETDGTVAIVCGELPVLTYHKAEVPPPEGVDPIYRRSGFIHPLHAPGGGEVTGIHPDDHYHHLGLWHAWVRTEHDGKEIDFWNLKGKTGRVRHSGIAEIRPAGFTAELEQVSYPKGPDAEPRVVLEERLSVDAALSGGDYLVDYVVEQKNVTDKPLELPDYRYGGGIAYRAPLHWDKENSDYLTSEGLRRADSHATRARWVSIHGPRKGGDKSDAAVTILCHPENHDAPQRIRTWNDGKVFFNYVPVQEKAWRIGPGETVVLRYRIVVSEGPSDADAAEQRWQEYAAE